MLYTSEPKRFTRQITTRCWGASATDSTNRYQLSRSTHVFWTAVTSFQPVLGNWVTGSTGDTNNAADSDIWAAEFESSTGVITPISFNGGSFASTGTPVSFPAGATLVADPVNISVGRGGIGRFRFGIHNPTTLINGGGLGDASLGDGMVVSTTSISYTSGDAIPLSANPGSLFAPVAIIGRTSSSAIAFTGDSLFAADPSYGVESLKNSTAYINFARSGTQSNSFTSVNSPKRTAIVNAYCSDVISDYGINDYDLGGVNAATLQTRLQTHWTSFSGPRIFHCCICPASTSTDSFATVGNQTQRSYGSDRITTNTYIRTTPAPLTGYFDANTVVESSTNSGLWAAPSKTTDGIHMTSGAVTAVVAASVIPPSTFP